MRIFPKISIYVFVMLFMVSSAHAATITINFQELVNNGTLPISTVVTNQFASQGVIFSLENIVNSSYPGPIADSFGSPETGGLFNTYNYFQPIIAAFTVPVNLANFSSIVDSPLTVQAFDESGNVIGIDSIPGGSIIGEIKTIDNIAALRFLNDSGTGYGGRDDLTIISSLCFNVVPIPGAIWLLGSGLIAFAGIRSRAKKC